MMMVVANFILLFALESWREEFMLYILLILILFWTLVVGLSYEVSKGKIDFYKFKYRYASLPLDEIKFLRIIDRTFSIMMFSNIPIILLGLKREDVNVMLNGINDVCNKFSHPEFLIISNNAKLLRGIIMDTVVLGILIYSLLFVSHTSSEVGFILICFLLLFFSSALIFKVISIKKL